MMRSKIEKAGFFLLEPSTSHGNLAVSMCVIFTILYECCFIGFLERTHYLLLQISRFVTIVLRLSSASSLLKKILLIIITIKRSKISTSSTGSFSQSRHIIMKSTKKSIKNFRKCNENVNNIASIWDTLWTLLVDVDRCAFLCNLIIVLHCYMVKRPCVVAVYSKTGEYNK